MGVWRTLSQATSGRDFLQQQSEAFGNSVQRASHFDALHSSRRRGLLEEVSWQLYVQGRQGQRDESSDLLTAFAELKGRAVWAVDGHKIKHASHAVRDSKGRQVAPNTLYMLCLHSGLLFNLAPVQGDGRYRHEMPVFRDALAHREGLRHGEEQTPRIQSLGQRPSRPPDPGSLPGDNSQSAGALSWLSGARLRDPGGEAREAAGQAS